MYDLSIIIPARNEMFLSRTIEDVLSNIEGKTEVIAVLDGYWANPPIKDDPRVTIIHHTESIGQRAATNEAVKLSKSKYIMKLDAHCSVAKNFDTVMIASMKDNYTMVPVMRNLHAFNWVCEEGHVRYQGPSGPCSTCQKPTKMDVVWIAKTNPQSSSYCFDPTPHFQYFQDYKRRAVRDGNLTETMSLQGSCFMMTRDKYWELNICDENFGSWGSQGIEVALKTRLSGGKVVVNHDTFYAHMFRTQGGDFSFPYPISGRQVEKAKKTARELFFENKWEKQIYPLSKIIDDFMPIPGWTDEIIKDLKQKELTSERSGIYSIKSLSNNRVYIGSSINISERVFEHKKKLKQNEHHNIHLQRTYNKYGENDLVYSILYFCKSEDLIKEEQKFIDEYKNKFGVETLFNICLVAGSSLGRECSEETRKKISETKLLNPHESWNKGLTKETDDRVREYGEKQQGVARWEDKEHPRGMLDKTHTSETKDRISASMTEVAKNRERDENGHFIRVMSSISSSEPTKGAIYYTDNKCDIQLAEVVRKQLKKAIKDMPLVTVSLEPIDFGTNFVLNEERGVLTMFRQILIALEKSTSDIIFFCEHDVLYHPSHFDFVPSRKDLFYYNDNKWKVDITSGQALFYHCAQVSGLCAYRELLLSHYREMVAKVEKEGYNRRWGYEPGTHTSQFELWTSTVPNVDIRHNNTLTRNRWSQDQFRDKRTCQGWEMADEVPGWGVTKGRMQDFLEEITNGVTQKAFA